MVFLGLGQEDRGGQDLVAEEGMDSRHQTQHPGQWENVRPLLWGDSAGAGPWPVGLSSRWIPATRLFSALFCPRPYGSQALDFPNSVL